MTNPAQPPVPQQKKGLHPLAWVAIGCGVLLVVGAAVAIVGGYFLYGKARELADNPAIATAKMIAAADPELEIVDTDEDAQTVTFRNTKTGDEMTISFDDIEKGRLTISSGGDEVVISGDEKGGQVTVRTDEGTARFGGGAEIDLPDWVPIYPGTTPEGSYSTDTAEGRGGAYTAQTDDSLDEVLRFFSDKLEAEGLESLHKTTTREGAILMTATPDESRTCTVTVTAEGGRVGIAVNFTEKKS